MYFKKKRAIASSIASAGTGVGILSMGPFISFMENNFGWDYTMIILSALMLACVPFGILFKPIKKIKPEGPVINVEKEAPESNDDVRDHPLITEHKFFTFLTPSPLSLSQLCNQSVLSSCFGQFRFPFLCVTSVMNGP